MSDLEVNSIEPLDGSIIRGAEFDNPLPIINIIPESETIESEAKDD
jgi:hypothetical protein